VGRTTRALAALVTVAVAVAAGCTKEVPPPGSPGDVVRRTGTLGTPVDMFGVEATVIAMEPFDQSPDGFPRIRVTIRTQSHLEVPWENPDVSVRCEESEERGDWYSGSTWEANGILPGGRDLEGQIILGFPPKPDAERYPVPTCTDGAVVVVGTDPQHRERQVVVRYPIPDEMVQAAIDAPRP
jgi:hypothetical protein